MFTHGKGKFKFFSLLTLVTLTILCCFSLNVFAATGSAKIINKGDIPSKPGNLTATVKENANGKKYFYLTWSASKDECSGIKEYKIYRNNQLIATTIDTDYIDRDVNNLDKYRYQVIAVDNNGHKSQPAQTGILTLEKNPAKKIINIKTGEIKYVTPIISNVNKDLKKIIHVQTGKISFKPVTNTLLSLNCFGNSWKDISCCFAIPKINLNSIVPKFNTASLGLSASLTNFLKNPFK